MALQKPEWLKIKAQQSENLIKTENILSGLSINTVCDKALCPNKNECYGKKTATFMILGKNCTRNCAFCNVEKLIPENVDLNEPWNVAKAVSLLKLRHVVITSVTRDDIFDGGASIYVETVREIRNIDENITVEVLIPDFKGDSRALKKIVRIKPEIIGHNIETIPRLYSEIRPMANYENSINVLKEIKQEDKSIYTKSSIMLGLGENKKEVIGVFEDLLKIDCDIMYVGQYLAPSKKHYPVKEYINPKVFEGYKDIGLKMGFKYMESGPFVRSSYCAEKALIYLNEDNEESS